MRRAIGIVAASAALLLIAAVAGLYWFLSGDGVRRAIEQQATGWMGQPVTIASARVTVWPRIGIALRQVGIGAPARVQLARVDLTASPLALLGRRLEDAEIRIRDTRIELPVALALPFAAASGGPGNPGSSGAAVESTPGAEGTGFRVVSVSSIVLDDMVAVSLNRELRISAQSSLVGPRLLVRELTVESGATSIRATGTVAFEPGVDADLRLAANRLDVDELLALAAAFLPASPGAAAPGPSARLKAAISASTARAAGVDARRFEATMTVEGERVWLSPLSFELFGGRYDGAIQARIGKQVSATLRAKVEGIDMAEVATFGGSPGTVTGRLSGNATVSGAGADLAAVLASARGNGSALVADGTLSRLGLVRTVVLFFGRPATGAPSSTDRFDRLDARFTLADRSLRAETFRLRSMDLDGDGTGTLDLGASRTLNGRLKVTLSEDLSRQAGTDLRRYTREDDRIVLPVVLSGTMNEPRVTIDAAAALQRGVRNEAERRLRGILDRFR